MGQGSVPFFVQSWVEETPHQAVKISRTKSVSCHGASASDGLRRSEPGVMLTPSFPTHILPPPRPFEASRTTRMGSAAERSIIPYGQFELLREAREIIDEEARALVRVAAGLDDDFCKAVDLLCECRGNVVASGMGKAGLIARKLAATLSSTGTPAHFLHPAEALHGDLGCLGTSDVLLVLSNSGETEEVCRILPLVGRFGIPIVAITATRNSTLGSTASATIELGRLREAGLHSLAPSTSTTAMLAVGEI